MTYIAYLQEWDDTLGDWIPVSAARLLLAVEEGGFSLSSETMIRVVNLGESSLILDAEEA